MTTIGATNNNIFSAFSSYADSVKSLSDEMTSFDLKKSIAMSEVGSFFGDNTSVDYMSYESTMANNDYSAQISKAFLGLQNGVNTNFNINLNQISAALNLSDINGAKSILKDIVSSSNNNAVDKNFISLQEALDSNNLADAKTALNKITQNSKQDTQSTQSVNALLNLTKYQNLQSLFGM